MAEAKSLDCVQMKNTIQARLRLEREGQREEEVHRNLLEWLETGVDGLARWWRSIPQSRASAHPPV